jgi:fibronectin type 3 domain-containing protein
MSYFLYRFTRTFSRARYLLAIAFSVIIAMAGAARADVTDRLTPAGTSVPNPGVQQQELANITAPAPYNVFEFVVTCAACHGGGIDQNAGHFGNWAGTNMASANRDPVFRANQLIVNSAVQAIEGKDGAGNMCFRCHTPNGWLSGRTDPLIAGKADGSTIIHSPLMSTDDEGVMCEMCHRGMGGVTMKRSDLGQADPVWNMMASIDDWPHLGDPYPAGPVLGEPYGDATLQINDGMTYLGKYSGSINIYFSDFPMLGTYTGQTYGIYPPGWPDEGLPVINPDGSIPIHFEEPICPPFDAVTGTFDYQAMALSLEHPTTGVSEGYESFGTVDFILTPEFCGGCHDLTIPILNHGMPEQRTYTEWKYSDFGRDKTAATYRRCQDCHMPTLKHEYADGTPVSLNPDPALAGWFPYAKDRNPDSGTTFHKLTGANRNLPQMMKLLYPEVDLEVIGAPTGNDTRIFPGMLSHRDPMFDRAKRNTDLSLLGAVTARITNGPVFNTTTGKWEVNVHVTNKIGHRIPSGYPDGRRFWLSLVVKDDTGNTVYQSGHYDPVTAKLYTDGSMTGLTRALVPAIDNSANAVMIYEKRTGSDPDGDGTYTMSMSLLNDTVLFDNRIPPAGFDYAKYQASGAKFVTYDPATLAPIEDIGRFTDNTDRVTYTFVAPSNAVLTARAEVYWQTNSREHMEFLKDNDTSTLRPEGPPSIYAVNYPLTPNYLSDVIGLDSITDLDGNPLRDNWGGIAYAAWRLTGKGAPLMIAADDTSVTAVPEAPANVTAVRTIDPATGLPDPFTLQVSWNSVANADGYVLWVRYGTDTSATEDLASWDRLALIQPDPAATTLIFRHEALNVAKTYQYRVVAFNGKGESVNSAVTAQSTPVDLPNPPENLKVLNTTENSVTLTWYDAADNETGFIIQRQDVPVIGDFYPVGDIPTPNNGGFGGVQWTDTTAQPSMTYNYRVAAYNASGMSTWSLLVQATTGSVPGGDIVLNAKAVSGIQIDLSWSGATGTINGYRVERNTTGPDGPWTTTFNVSDPLATAYSDLTVTPNTTYWYRVFAYNLSGDSLPSNVMSALTLPVVPPSAPSDLAGLVPSVVEPIQVDLTWTDNATDEDGFIIERGQDGITFTEIDRVGPDTVAYSDLTVEPKMTYYYRVAAYNTGGLSGYSNVAAVITPGEIPQAPAELTVTRIRASYIILAWIDNANNEAGFYLERSADGATFNRIATMASNTTEFKDKNLEQGTTYWYRIQAFNADGVSEFSNTVSGTTHDKAF